MLVFGLKPVNSSNSCSLAFFNTQLSFYKVNPSMNEHNGNHRLCLPLPPRQNKRSGITNSDGKKARTTYRERKNAWIYILKQTCWKRVLPLFSFSWGDFKSYEDAQDSKIQHSNNERNTYCTSTSANHMPSGISRIILSFLNTKSWFCMWLCSRFNF